LWKEKAQISTSFRFIKRNKIKSWQSSSCFSYSGSPVAHHPRIYSSSITDDFYTHTNRKESLWVFIIIIIRCQRALFNRRQSTNGFISVAAWTQKEVRDEL
jgi:hypothetical protein